MPEVPLSQLRPTCDPAIFTFNTTAELPSYVGLIGQERAVEAIKFGLAITDRGFNICVSGQPGTGRTTAIREYLEVFARNHPPPDEWLYVHNFSDPYRPQALCLPPGKGRELKNAMTAMLNEAKERLPRVFESEDFVSRRDEIVGGIQRARETLFTQMAQQAMEGGFLLQGNPGGFFLVPLAADGNPMDDKSFMELGEEERAAILQHRDQLMEQLRAHAKRAQAAEVTATERIVELQQTVATTVVDSLMDALFDAFKSYKNVTEFLFQVSRDMVDNVRDFLPEPPQLGPMRPTNPLRKYEVNLLVDSSRRDSAPVVFESNPLPHRVLGRIEKEAFFGAVSTDFTMIRAGSLHEANGGYLVLNFDDLLQYPLTWSELKRALRTGYLTIEELGERVGVIETKTVRPEPIPWTGKIIGIAREEVYRLLYGLDPDFKELFKVKADFDLHISRTTEHVRAYAGLIASVTRKEGLPAFDRGAVARVVDEGVKLAEDHEQLSIRFGDLTDIVREASHWARVAEAAVVAREHVDRAIRERTHRVNLIEEHVRQAIARGIIVVDVGGVAIGQVNGLSVVELGDTSFGQPARITATVGVGRDGIVDLQRETQLSGPIFSKAVLTLQGFLTDRYALHRPLALAASISFEQSYGVIEGDSATCAETCALLSRIANLPAKQSLAITGSMDQNGEVQAIGGVNQKIEGFFDVCRIHGLTGEQGVVIPATNIQHLMLREDVVEAISMGQFRIYSVSHIDEALELLLGMPAGQRQEDGVYPSDSVHGRVLARLEQISERLHEDSRRGQAGGGNQA